MPLVGPITETHVPVVYDTDSNGFGGPGDMRGPAIGELTYSQPSDNLLVKINLEFGQPLTTYQVFLVCGPAHALGCGFTTIGTLGTDAVGAGSAVIPVPFPVLHSPPFGPGYRTDHIDLLQGVGDLSKGVLTAGAINYFVCERQGHPGKLEEERKAESSLTGDPHGERVSAGDPGGAKQRG